MRKTIKKSLALVLAMLMLLTISPMGWATEYCPTCEKNVTPEHHAQSWPTCTEYGYSKEGDYCPDCGYCFTNVNGFRLDKDPHDYKKVDEKEATCTEPGNIEHYTCTVCNGLFLKDGEVYTETTAAAVKNGDAKGHAAGEKQEAVAATCAAAGNIAYYECTRCHHYFSDQACTTELTTTVDPQLSHHIVKQEAVPATCQADGTQAYWYCDRTGCGAKFSDAAGNTPVADENALVIPRLTNHIPEAGDEWAYFADDGGVFDCAVGGYKVPLCKFCGALLDDEDNRVPVAGGAHDQADRESYFANDGGPFVCSVGGYSVMLCRKCGKELSTHTSVAPTNSHADLDYTAVPKTCTQAGISAYTICKKCGIYLYNTSKTIIPAGGHHKERVPAHPATCTETGWTEHWKCTECGMIFAEEEGVGYLDDEDMTAPGAESAMEKAGVLEDSNGHAFVNQGSAKAATCTEDGKRQVVKCSVATCNQLAMVMSAEEKDMDGVYRQNGRYYKNISNESEAKLNKTDHDWVKNTASADYVPATCSKEGSVPAVCGNGCGATTIIVLDKTKHTNNPEVQVQVVKPTCERGKYEIHKCKVCGQDYEIDFYNAEDPATEVDGIKPLGHRWSGESKQVKEATCTEPGLYGQPCLNGCGQCKNGGSATPKALGHNYKPFEQKATCTEAGFTAKKCERCGDIIEKKETQASGHKDDNKDAKCDICETILCDHMCHKQDFFSKFIWFIMNVWNQFLGINQNCKCGLQHYTKASNLVVPD